MKYRDKVITQRHGNSLHIYIGQNPTMAAYLKHKAKALVLIRTGQYQHVYLYAQNPGKSEIPFWAVSSEDLAFHSDFEYWATQRRRALLAQIESGA
jgi:hypothetical protein